MKLSRNFPLNALRVFDSAARHLSFTKAGEELGMTQTAVSYQIKLLEDFVGSALFERKPRQLQLTENGKRLAPRVTDGLETLVEAVADLKQSRGGRCSSTRRRHLRRAGSLAILYRSRSKIPILPSGWKPLRTSWTLAD